MSTTLKLEKFKSIKDIFKPFEHFCKAMLDAYVVVDSNGKIIKTNQLFSQLTGMKTKQILKSNSLDELISFFVNDQLITVKDILSNMGPTRIDEVNGKTRHAEGLNLIIGIYPFINNESGELYGSFILIRDVTAETNLQGKYKDKAIKSITDPLTGLFTRGYFEEYLDLQLKAISRLPADSGQKKMSIIMTDIDFFKKVNDKYGHQAGDFVLQNVAKIMKMTFRGTDVICRYGGEEFLIILPSTDISGAEKAGEKLRFNIENEKFVFEETHIPITISIGVAQSNIELENFAATITRADDALYEAKKGGRNKVCVAKPLQKSSKAVS